MGIASHRPADKLLSIDVSTGASVQPHKHTHMCSYTQTPRQVHSSSHAHCRNIFHTATSTVFFQLNWMINAYCESLPVRHENTFHCSLGNECYATVGPYCHVTWLHHKHPSCTREKKEPEATIQAFVKFHKWMTGSFNGLTYINVTYSHQNTTSFPSNLWVPEILLFKPQPFLLRHLSTCLSAQQTCVWHLLRDACIFRVSGRDTPSGGWMMGWGLGKTAPRHPRALTFKI